MEEMEAINKLTEKVIGCAIEVHSLWQYFNWR
jgi:hypothetical protein